jgi:glycerol dehydrogenase
LAEASSNDLRRIGEAAVKEGKTIHNTPFTVTGDDVVQALLAADRYAKAFKQSEK